MTSRFTEVALYILLPLPTYGPVKQLKKRKGTINAAYFERRTKTAISYVTSISLPVRFPCKRERRKRGTEIFRGQVSKRMISIKKNRERDTRLALIGMVSSVDISGSMVSTFGEVADPKIRTVGTGEPVIYFQNSFSS